MLSKRAGPLVAVLATALILAPSAASGNYADASGDAFGDAGDIASVTVMGDKTSGQVVFQISGSNLASSADNKLFIDIDADANPTTGSQMDSGAEYGFSVDNDGYGFGRWDGSGWVNAPNSTVRVSGNTSRITISVNRSELGNSAGFNFVATTLSIKRISPTVATIGLDLAPDDGAYNYSIEANGPQINSVDVRTTPTTGPRAGKQFVVVPTALHLPPDGRTTPATIVPESYSCTAKVGTKKLAGKSTGGCTFIVPKKTRGKKLTVQLTVNYQGATNVVPLTFKVK